MTASPEDDSASPAEVLAHTATGDGLACSDNSHRSRLPAAQRIGRRFSTGFPTLGFRVRAEPAYIGPPPADLELPE